MTSITANVLCMNYKHITLMLKYMVISKIKLISSYDIILLIAFKFHIENGVFLCDNCLNGHRTIFIQLS